MEREAIHDLVLVELSRSEDDDVASAATELIQRDADENAILEQIRRQQGRA
ncbi:hypothetical protein GCM10011519_33700 [Marmoricola endophyticus]|uniref:Uncharacterized protein n=1 Tax=Marmoricola endophyticus TaxID=2040280 RepID=A0A917BSF7_9ACTN|nr:hypothetical protein [Marmoricola endophyticus]GGF56997.1 hypothetical protein GCM10011519_33700 [Marmoricola endophyticus]